MAASQEKVRSSVAEMAKELLTLYARRKALPGYGFSADTVWQREFEDAFPYEETPDQLKAIQEIKTTWNCPIPWIVSCAVMWAMQDRSSYPGGLQSSDG